MSATISPVDQQPRFEMPDSMGRKPKPPTKTLRVHVDVEQMAQACAKMDGVPAPEWVSSLLRPILQERLRRSAERLAGDDKPKRRKPD